MSISEVLTSIENLANSISGYYGNPALSNHSFKNISSFIVKTYSEMDKHVDVCNRIAASFYLPGIKYTKTLEYKNLKASINSYKSHIGLINNKIKHEQNTISFLTMKSRFERILGYYLTDSRADGAVGPNPDVHGNDNSAMSLNRDIRVLFVRLVYLSLALKEFLKEFPYNENESVEVMEGQTDSDMFRVATAISAIPPMVFPDELEKENSEVFAYKVENGEEILLFSLFERNPALRSFIPILADRLEISGHFLGDGFTKSFKMPYLARE